MKERQRWQPEEDALLRAYVKQYGPKEWNLIPQRMGKPLDRDPKSCLERWKNYLKPGIKKGSLTAEEQSLVISLQAKYGNKWKKIAAEVPGRTAKRLGKWWEVFKEKQLKQLQKVAEDGGQDYGNPPAATAPKLFAYQSPSTILIPGGTLPLPEPPPILSLGSAAAADTDPVNPVSGLPPWMNMNTTPTTTSSLTSSSSTPSPSVSLTLSPSDPAVLDPAHPETVIQSRFFPVQQMGSLIQLCKDLEERKENWMRHKKEATWRLSRLEQQLESEKARRRREKMEEIEARMRCIKEEETAFLSRMEGEYREQLNALQRDAEAKEAKLMEAWCNKHSKVEKVLEQIGIHASNGFPAIPHSHHM
ncbi:hypothetical protein F511_29141 [Dorcoceras hygrometricum]|uniref:Uncharacterized protein n=1 Tax=Dorcoceras hygrometricum TaxID=472368 RepID=A0A2Z7BNE8_9LAMI|nr:hypothetical protein F511_29141 [Dorcoceras hygrometricum]